MVDQRKVGWLARTGVVACAAGLFSILPSASALGANTTTLYVSPSAKAGAAGTSCARARFSTIQAAVRAAPAGATVVACAGAYKGQVTVFKPILLSGEHATIDATGSETGVTVAASGATVEGFTIRGAIGEGILVVGKPGAPVEHVTVKGNLVEGNDRGNPTGAPIKTSPYRECDASGPVPGDCGEGIHLMVVAYSDVSGNTVTANAGGILLTDEFGPTDHNTIQGNTVTGNVLDCGITLASHSQKAFAGGKAVPAAGGIFDNTVTGNVSHGNGTKGDGAGVLLAAALPGGATYANTVEHNVISGNGQSGVTVHSHTPNQDLDGNVVDHNVIGQNNLAGDADYKPAVDMKTTGVLVATAKSPISITISDNNISHDTYGVWQLGPVTISGMSTNTFWKVTFPKGTGGGKEAT